MLGIFYLVLWGNGDQRQIMKELSFYFRKIIIIAEQILYQGANLEAWITVAMNEGESNGAEKLTAMMGWLRGHPQDGLCFSKRQRKTCNSSFLLSFP